MPAYVLVDIEVHDPVLFEEYKKRAPQTVADYGGKYLARGGQTEVLDGSQPPGRVVVLEFPSMDRAREWYNCSEYRDAIKFRHASATSQFTLVEGL